MTKHEFDEWIAGVAGDSRLPWTVKRTAIATTLDPRAKRVPQPKELAELRHLSVGTIKRHLSLLRRYEYIGAA